MKSYVKVYLDFFDYTITDKIICEVCKENIAVDIHHVINRKQNSKLLNEITNLVALCRSCHHSKGDKAQYIAEFQEIINKRHEFSQSSTNRQQPNADS